MNSTKCTSCGLVNFVNDEACRRCGGHLMAGYAPLTDRVEVHDDRRGFWEYILWASGVTITILGLGYGSLLYTSEPLTADERKVVTDAVRVLDESGFSQQTFALRHLVSFRRTDHWWNRYVGHQTAYAATNFPFGIVTLYPTFFKYPVDEREHATILLHESYHLFGDGEEKALERVWKEKQRLGWTAARYGSTRVFKNTREWTSGSVPSLFTCGADGQSDCLE